MQKLLFILGELSDDDIDWIIQSSCREEVETGTVLIEKGSPLDKLYILIDGTVKVSVDHQVLATLHPGERSFPYCFKYFSFQPSECLFKFPSVEFSTFPNLFHFL